MWHVFYRVFNRNTSGSSREREMLWEHEPQTRRTCGYRFPGEFGQEMTTGQNGKVLILFIILFTLILLNRIVVSPL